MTFTSIDFETANYSRASICAAGIACFEDGKLVESLYWLVRPPKGHGWFLPEFTENCHGLAWFDVQDAPEFPAIAPALLERLTRSNVVIAHNAQFDISALQATLQHFGLPCPEFNYLCTYRLATRIWPDLPDHRLNTVAAHIGHEFHHHHAQADAETAGRVLLAIMKYVNAKALADLSLITGVTAQQFCPGRSCQGSPAELQDPCIESRIRIHSS
jgi:DNA polymerase III subunit epsilon